MLSFDDRDGQIWFNGEMVDWRDAKIHVLSHGLHYASAVFEGERVYDRQIFKLTEHTERLVKSGRILGFEIPWSASPRSTPPATWWWKRPASSTAMSGRSPGAAAEMMGVSAQKTKINLAIAAWEWPAYFSPEARMEGITMTVSDWRRPAPDTAPTDSKAAGLYMICTLSKHAAEGKGISDALMLDYRGQIAEATGANIFLVIDGKIHTPTPDCFLDGITRRTVMDWPARTATS